MPKQWWSSRSMLLAQGACVLVLAAWSIHHSPPADAASPAAPAEIVAPSFRDAADSVVIDNSDGEVTVENLSQTDSRFVAPPAVHFRTDHPASGTLNLRPIETKSPAQPDQWQPVHPQNPPLRAPSGPRSPFELSGNGATVYNPPPTEEN